jgi:PAS domain S-box-containing protein
MCLVGIHTDVTKLRAVEQALTDRDAALLESERRFKTLFDCASDGIFIKDGELRYTDVNTIMLQFLSMQISDMIGKTDKDLFGKDMAVRTRNVESRVLKGQTIETQESLLYKSEPISVDCMRFPLRDSSHEIIGVCGIVREMVYCPQTHSGEFSPGNDYLSPAMRSMILRARIAAETDSSIILTGESGSGKDFLARYIHEHSLRCHGPFYAINCAAIPSELAESELFGHEAGSFTGATKKKRGLIELAEGGTLLLNEIGELSYPIQGKLLQFLDTFSFARVGGEKKVTVNKRLIAATNRDLGSEVCVGRFRKDLYYRLNVFPIHVPSLRERKEDIPLLVKEIVSVLTANMALQKPAELDFGALRRLCMYSWPGNVRELRNVLERSLILSRGATIGVQHLVGMGESEGADSLLDTAKPLNRSLYDILGETERALIQEALRRSDGKKAWPRVH